MYFTSGSDRAFEQLMQTRPGADHFDNGEAGAPEDCGTCRFYRPHWKYQFCVYEECPYQPGKLTALDGAVKFQVKGVDDEMAVFRVEKNRGYACCLCSSSLKKRSDPKEIPAKSRFFRKPYKKREGADCVLPKTKQRVVMHPPFRHSSVEFEWPRQSRPR